MSHDIGSTNAKELSLMEEEKWLIETLKKVRTQRNSLKVEALYFQGLTADLFTRHAVYFNDEPNNSNNLSADEIEFEPIPEPVNQTNGECIQMNHGMSSNIDDFNLVEQRCNQIELQDLNLNLIPDNKPSMNMDMDYESEEEGEWDKIPLEMGLLVSGHFKQFDSDSDE